MVAWERQIEERCVPAWRDKYVQYGKLKRMLEQVKVKSNEEAEIIASMHLALADGVSSPQLPAPGELEAGLLDEDNEKLRKEFMEAVHAELHRVSSWYDDAATALEARVRDVISGLDATGGAAGLKPASEHFTEDIDKLHLEAAQLTEYVLLNVEALRKIVKKMDKMCGTSEQKAFVEKHLKRSAFASPNDPKHPLGGQRAKQCRKALEECLSPERIQELRCKALTTRHGAKPGKEGMKRRRALACALIATAVVPASERFLPNEPRAQRCVGLVMFTVAMWISEAAPFEATALAVPPLAVLLNLLPGDKLAQGHLVLNSVFTDSLYLVLCGFVISSVFTKCQLECRTAAMLQRRLGDRPFLFMLAVMFLGLLLSALLSNVTAPLLIVEVLKPLLRDMPTDSRYSRALLLGLAFSCNIGGMVTPISSPQNIAALTILEQHGGHLRWDQWLSVSLPFCTVAVFMGWSLLLVVHHFDASPDERARTTERDRVVLPSVVFDREDITLGKAMSLASACAVLFAFAYRPAAIAFGGTPVVAMFYISIALATGMVSRSTFNSYSWHLLFLIGGGSALGFVVNDSGLLAVMTHFAKRGLSSQPFTLVAELALVLVGATTFVSHTVAALVFMPLVVKLGASAGVQELAVLVCGLACSVACALPMTSFPNVNSLLATDDSGKPWLAMKHFLRAGAPMTIFMALLLITFGTWLAGKALADVPRVVPMPVPVPV